MELKRTRGKYDKQRRYIDHEATLEKVVEANEEIEKQYHDREKEDLTFNDKD